MFSDTKHRTTHIRSFIKSVNVMQQNTVDLFKCPLFKKKMDVLHVSHHKINYYVKPSNLFTELRSESGA